MGRDADGSYRAGTVRLNVLRRGKSGSDSCAFRTSTTVGGFGVLLGSGAITVGRGGDGITSAGDAIWACCKALTAVPFHTVPLGRAFALSTCIGSALVPLRRRGGKSVVLGAGT